MLKFLAIFLSSIHFRFLFCKPLGNGVSNPFINWSIAFFLRRTVTNKTFSLWRTDEESLCVKGFFFWGTATFAYKKVDEFLVNWKSVAFGSFFCTHFRFRYISFQWHYQLHPHHFNFLTLSCRRTTPSLTFINRVSHVSSFA